MNIANLPQGFLIAIPATAESIMRAMSYLNYYYGKETFCTTIHICGSTCYIEM